MKKKQWITWSLLLAVATAAHSQTTPATAASLAGKWQLVASNNGIEVAPGIYSPRTDTINFTAVPSDDGTALRCHADSFYTRTGTVYPADWRMTVENDTQGHHRLGWILDTEKPLSDLEFKEPHENYLENGFWYWGGSSEGHRYIYLLAENADASAIVGMTFWSPWSSGDATEYSLSNTEQQSRKMYAVVSETVPYTNIVGFIEIWSSPVVKRVGALPAGISTLASEGSTHTAPAAWFDLQGRRLNGKPSKGVYIRNGRKWLVR